MAANRQQFSVTAFVQARKPYRYMVDCGFGSDKGGFPEAELKRLSAEVVNLLPDHKALAFAIAENYAPELFVESAIEHLNDSELSVRLGAYNCLVKMPREKIPMATLQRIREAIERSPERDMLTDFGNT